MSFETFPPLPEWFWYPVVFVYGAVVGSFLNVLIYRLPLGMSVSHPKSHCPRCNHYLGFWDNIPLLAFLFLGARCRYCRTPISWRYFSVELVTACLWTLLYHRISGLEGVSWVDFVGQALFASVLVALVFIDLDHFIVPDEMNWVGSALGLGRDIVCLVLAWQSGAWVWKEWGPHFSYFGWLPRGIVGGLVYGGVLFLVSFLGFIYYAREENETLSQAGRRFFDMFRDEDAAEEDAPPAAPPVATPTNSGSVALPSTAAEGEEEEEEGEPVRLRFSPGFLAFVSALLLSPMIGSGWASLAFLLPFGAFVLLSPRHEAETFGQRAFRFFRADDLGEYAGAMETATVTADETQQAPLDAETMDEDDEEAEVAPPVAPEPETVSASLAAMAQAEADQFAREAETGTHGGMGLGDAKLAFAIGTILGPGMALLSLFFAAASGALVGIVLARIHGKNLKIGLPFVPFMAFGAILVMLYGPDMVTWYLHRMWPAQ